MAIDEQGRHHLYTRLQQEIGDRAATVLMEHLPPVGWADVATKTDVAMLRRDLDALEERMNLRFEVVDQRFDSVDRRFDAVDQRFDGLERRIGALESAWEGRFGRLERHTDTRFDQVDRRFDQLVAELGALRMEMHANHRQQLFAIIAAVVSVAGLGLVR